MYLQIFHTKKSYHLQLQVHSLNILKISQISASIFLRYTTKSVNRAQVLKKMREKKKDVKLIRIVVLYIFCLSFFKLQSWIHHECTRLVSFALHFLSCNLVPRVSLPGDREQRERHWKPGCCFFLVPRRHYCARSMRFWSRGLSKFFFPRPFVSDTSLKYIDCEGLGKCGTGARQVALMSLFFNPLSLRLININFLLEISVNHQGKRFEELIK